jgi:hypothetical protein
MNTKQLKKQLILNIPYIILGLLATNLGEAWRIAAGVNASEKVQSLVLDGRRTIRAHDSSDIRKCVRHNRIRTLCRHRDMR